MRISVYNIKGYLYIKDLDKNKMLTTKIYVGNYDIDVMNKAKRLVFGIYNRSKHRKLADLVNDINNEILKRSGLL